MGNRNLLMEKVASVRKVIQSFTVTQTDSELAETLKREHETIYALTVKVSKDLESCVEVAAKLEVKGKDLEVGSEGSGVIIQGEKSEIEGLSRAIGKSFSEISYKEVDGIDDVIIDNF